jgi:hypothetical protein
MQFNKNKKKSESTRKIISVILALLVVLSLVPTSWAAQNTGGGG